MSIAFLQNTNTFQLRNSGKRCKILINPQFLILITFDIYLLNHRETVLNSFNKLSNDIFRKSDERANRHRLGGNELYQKQSYQEALKEYDEVNQRIIVD